VPCQWTTWKTITRRDSVIITQPQQQSLLPRHRRNHGSGIIEPFSKRRLPPPMATTVVTSNQICWKIAALVVALVVAVAVHEVPSDWSPAPDDSLPNRRHHRRPSHRHLLIYPNRYWPRQSPIQRLPYEEDPSSSPSSKRHQLHNIGR